MENEIWKPIKGYERLYEISNYGNVRSLDRYIICGKGKRLIKGKILKLRIGRDNRIYINLHKNDTDISYSVHRLVAETFLDNPNNYPQVNHKDENPQNNSVYNLEWCTASYNINYGTAIQRAKEKLINKPSLSKRVIQYSLDGELIKEWASMREAERNGFNASMIWRCCNNIRKTHKGYIWKYKN